jgi:hypothetical protein
VAVERDWAREHVAVAAGRSPAYVAAADVGGHDVPGSSAPDTVGALLVGHLPPAPTGLYTGEERWRFYVEPPEPRRRTSRNRTTLLSPERMPDTNRERPLSLCERRCW